MAGRRGPADRSTLPDTILVNILQHVPIRDRLQRCAFVSRSWKAAAAEACTDITHNLPNDLQAGEMKDFLKWACIRAQQCSALQLSGARPDRRYDRTPCLPQTRYTLPKLRDLTLHSFTIQDVGPFTAFVPEQQPGWQPRSKPVPVPRLPGGRRARRDACKAAQAEAEARAEAEAAWAAEAAPREGQAAAWEAKLSRPAKKLELDWEVTAAPQPAQAEAAQPALAPAAQPRAAAAARPVRAAAAKAIAVAAPQAQAATAAQPAGPVSATRVNIFCGCQHITSLQLLSCITGPPEARKGKVLHALAVLVELKGLTGLRRLALDVKGPAFAYKPGRVISNFKNALPASMWSGLTQLTHLDLSKQRDVDAECIQGLTHLTALQELRLLASPPNKPEDLATLEHLQALSVLELHGATGCKFDADNASFLSALPKLQHVALLQYRSLDARVLSVQLLRRLRYLHLEGCPQPVGRPLLPQAVLDQGTNTWEPVLAVLADCTALTELRLSQLHDPRSTNPNSLEYMPGYQDADDAAARGALAAAATAAVDAGAAAFAALTASTHLQTLHLSSVSLTPGAWAHIVPADHQLPCLHYIKLSNCNQALGSTGVEQMVACCPGLTALCLSGALQLSASVRPLLRLTQLRQLQLLQRVDGDVVEVLAHLDSLQGLDTGDGYHAMLWTGKQLKRMTRLKRLTSFKGRCQWEAIYAVTPAEAAAGPFCFLNQAPSRLMPDVRQQLSGELQWRREYTDRLEEQARCKEQRQLDDMAVEEDLARLGAMYSDDDMGVDEP